MKLLTLTAAASIALAAPAFADAVTKLGECYTRSALEAEGFTETQLAIAGAVSAEAKAMIDLMNSEAAATAITAAEAIDQHGAVIVNAAILMSMEGDPISVAITRCNTEYALASK